jgi:FAD synthase
MKGIEATSGSFHRKNDGEISSEIHSLIKEGKMEAVLALLGRPYLTNFSQKSPSSKIRKILGGG